MYKEGIINQLREKGFIVEPEKIELKKLRTTYSITKTKQKVIKLSCKFMQVHKV
ncbi:MAG: hypothetical protein IPP34_19260 [Bacteroidetes bacterium]|nr:hypothetical protein [Bacteroidota bacterium]